MTNDMELRDYFAGQAMVGLLARYPSVFASDGGAQSRDVAKHAYEFANAMMAARVNQPEQSGCVHKCETVFLPGGGQRTTCIKCGEFNERY